jgi:hypothetical protein
VSVAIMAFVSALFILTTAPGQVAVLQFVCHPIRPGDTASLLAHRLTGDPENRRHPWFRIVDPTTSRVISKSHYHVIRPGWLACIAAEPGGYQSRGADDQSAGSVQVRPATPQYPGGLEAIDLVFVGCWAGFCLLITLLLWSVADRYVQKTQLMLDRMRLFGDMFIREFERPLAPYGRSDRPVRSRVRYMPHRRRLDILLAPDGGRHYPNLSDHKKNVEYDVERIVQSLRQEPFVSGRLHAQGPWVVIPFEFKPNTKTEGVL